MQHSITSDREGEIERQREEASWQVTVGMIFVWKWTHLRISIVRSFSKGVAVLGSACCLTLLSLSALGWLKGPRPIHSFS